jgi:hypothetical protein
MCNVKLHVQLLLLQFQQQLQLPSRLHNSAYDRQWIVQLEFFLRKHTHQAQAMRTIWAILQDQTDPNYTGASKHISSLLKVADYLEKKKLGFERTAAGQSYEQVYTSYQAKGGDKMNIGQKGKADVTQGQYASLLNSGSYLPPNLPETMAVEIRAAIQNGRALGVTVVTTPANPAIASKIDAAVRQIQFTPASEKMDFTTTKFPPAA